MTPTIILFLLVMAAYVGLALSIARIKPQTDWEMHGSSTFRVSVLIVAAAYALLFGRRKD